MRRRLAFLVNGSSALSEARIPDANLAPVNQSVRRRLIDDIEAISKRACAANEIEAAADLLTLLEKWHTRRPERPARDRRLHNADLRRIRGELDRLRTLRNCRHDTAPGTPRP